MREWWTVLSASRVGRVHDYIALDSCPTTL